MGRIIGGAFAAAALTIAGCGDNGTSDAGGSREVERGDYGDEWPLTVESGTLACERPGLDAVTFTTGGTTYALNGTAISLGQSEGWPEVDAIWADNPEQILMDGENVAQPKMNIGVLIDDGLELCE